MLRHLFYIMIFFYKSEKHFSNYEFRLKSVTKNSPMIDKYDMSIIATLCECHVSWNKLCKKMHPLCMVDTLWNFSTQPEKKKKREKFQGKMVKWPSLDVSISILATWYFKFYFRTSKREFFFLTAELCWHSFPAFHQGIGTIYVQNDCNSDF